MKHKLKTIVTSDGINPTGIDLELLRLVASGLTGWDFSESKWGNHESEVIASQTLSASVNNLDRHGDPLSWVGRGALSGYTPLGGGIDNYRGVKRMEEDMVIMPYLGAIQPGSPETIAKEGDHYLVFRITRSGLNYMATLRAHNLQRKDSALAARITARLAIVLAAQEAEQPQEV